MKRSGILIATLGLFLFAQAAQADWTPAKRLTWNSGLSEFPAIAVDSFGNLHVVWRDETSEDAEVYYKKSTDRGATWTTRKRLTWNLGYSAYPALAVDGSENLHVVWEYYTPGNNDIYYKKSTDGGATWTTAKKLTWTQGCLPAIAVDSSDNIHLVWEDGTTVEPEIYFTKSTDGGATWKPNKRITWTSGGSWNPGIAVDHFGKLHMVWEDDTRGNREIFYKKSTDGGITWSPNKRLAYSSGDSFWPGIAIDSSGNLHVVWYDYMATNTVIYYKKSPDGGTSWSKGQRLTWTSGYSLWPGIAVDSSGNLHMVWCDDTPGNCEIYYKKSGDGGATWTTSQRLTWNSGSSLNAVIGVDSFGNLHVVWEDYTPGNWEIYYKKDIK